MKIPHNYIWLLAQLLLSFEHCLVFICFCVQINQVVGGGGGGGLIKKLNFLIGRLKSGRAERGLNRAFTNYSITNPTNKSLQVFYSYTLSN